ncbi:MAG TPA: glycosyltransferase family 4 protein [Rhizomicrobium sp.]|jgi:glycosyltransferase involved in cell wall biosynthesis
MRFLTVSHFYEAHGGGIERVAAQLCRQFARDGHAVTWAASDSDLAPQEPIRAVPLRCANPIETRTGLPMPIPGLRALRDLSRAIGASDAVIIHDALYLTSIAAMFLAKLRNKPVVLIQHIAAIEFANSFLRKLIRLANTLVTRPMLHAAKLRVFISNEVRRQLMGDIQNERSMLLFNGVDTTIFHPTDILGRNAVRMAHGLSPDAQLAIFVGRFVEKKGLSILQEVARSRPELRIFMAGTGPIHPENWGISNVEVLGTKSQQSLAELYGAADFLLLPSVGEGYPLVIQEAMACGLPVICGQGSALADPNASAWLRGVMIDLMDPIGSASRCNIAIDDLNRAAVDRSLMAEYAAKSYSWARMAGAITQSLSRPVEVGHAASGSLQPG